MQSPVSEVREQSRSLLTTAHHSWLPGTVILSLFFFSVLLDLSLMLCSLVYQVLLNTSSRAKSEEYHIEEDIFLAHLGHIACSPSEDEQCPINLGGGFEIQPY